jgi:Holliday junction resolvase RusA-like endonuclease
MVKLELNKDELDVFWTAMINQICKEHMSMQDSKTAKELLDHKNRKDICDNLVKKIKDYL